MIGPGTTVRGNISGEENLTVEGRVEGSIRLDADLVIADGASLAADVDARKVDVSGKVEGAISAAEGLTLDSGAVVVGDITTQRLIIEEGARIKGRINMDVEIPGLEKGHEKRADTGRRR